MTCSRCGAEFDVAKVRRKYEKEFDGLEYDWDFPSNDVCFECAECEARSNISEGIDVLSMKRGGFYDSYD